MAAVDKNLSVIEYLLTCPAIANNSVFFNAIQAEDKAKQIITIADDRNTHKPYIDGTVEKRYTFTIMDFRSVSYLPIVVGTGYSNENVEDMLDVQGIIDWIEEQNDNRNFPDFGNKCVIDSIHTGADNPNLNGLDTNTSPALAKYSISVIINYLDKSKALY